MNFLWYMPPLNRSPLSLSDGSKSNGEYTNIRNRCVPPRVLFAEGAVSVDSHIIISRRRRLNKMHKFYWLKT